MDYEKEYNHAFEIAKGYWGGVTDFVRGILESMFPQLAESEDERIRKDIVTYLRNELHNITQLTPRTNEIERWIAYLEKQKEQKPSTPDDIAAAYQMGLAKGRKEQKPAEWSEDDELLLNAAIYMVEKGNITFAFENNKSKVSDWLKLLPERFGLQPKQEWSEKDKTHLGWIIECFDSWKYQVPEFADQYQSAIDFLKSLRPQPHWKPSEEQMGALNYAYCELFKRQDDGHNILNPLQNLIDTLSKL